MKSTNGKRFAAATVSLLLAGTIFVSCGCTSLSLFKHKHKSPRRNSAVPQYAYPRYPGLAPKEKKTKSWLGDWGEAEEPKKADSVPEWLEQNKRIPIGDPR